MDQSTAGPLACSILAVVFLAAACTSGGSGASQELASDQTLRFALRDDLHSLDPAFVETGQEITFLPNLFNGLVKYDEKLRVVPDAAQGLPDVSSDGLRYVFHLRRNVRFSNGDQVTARDWIWSFTRVLRLNQAYASNLEALKGAVDVESGKAKDVAGLSAPDEYTLKATVEHPAGYWLSQLAMPTAALVLDRRVLEATGDPDSQKWTQNPQTYVGTGPFKMTQRMPKQVMEFEPVANWWGGATGTLRKIHVDIGVDDVAQVKKFESGGLDVVGMAAQPLSPADLLRYRQDPAKTGLLRLFPTATTAGVMFNFVQGPFADVPGTSPGEPTSSGTQSVGLSARQAFSQSIDRVQFADVVCSHSITCVPATGGPITKGFRGYLGDNGDRYAKFDVNAGKAAFQKAGGVAKFKGVQYRYNQSTQNAAAALNLQSQWKANLGVDIALAPSDDGTFIRDGEAKRVIIGRVSWGVDYDDPQDWFDNLFSCTQATIGRGNRGAYCNPQLDSLVREAKAKEASRGLPLYRQANEILTKDIVWATIAYGRLAILAQPYVQGWGRNALYEYSWSDIKILKH